jgi:hypothetical protein
MVEAALAPLHTKGDSPCEYILTRGYNNSQNQFTVILALDTSQCKGRADTYCTIYN